MRDRLGSRSQREVWRARPRWAGEILLSRCGTKELLLHQSGVGSWKRRAHPGCRLAILPLDGACTGTPTAQAWQEGWSGGWLQREGGSSGGDGRGAAEAQAGQERAAAVPGLHHAWDLGHSDPSDLSSHSHRLHPTALLLPLKLWCPLPSRPAGTSGASWHISCHKGTEAGEANVIPGC